MAGLFLSIQIALIQISSVYLRYLPFRTNLTEDEIKIFWRKMFLLCAIIITAHTILFAKFGVSPLIYKMAMLAGAAIYFALSVILILEKLIYHVFALGMQLLWTILLHTAASMTNSFLQQFLAVNEIFLQSLLYLLFFAALWRVEVNLFENILPARRVMEKEFKWYIALLPLPIFAGIFIPMFDNVLLHSFKERIVRFFIPLFFFLLYRSINLLTLQIEQKNRQEYLNKILSQQLQRLKARDSVIQENQRQISVFRHDLRHNYRLIAAMLRENKIAQAIEFISNQDKLLRQVEFENAAQSSITHSVVSIYLRKAQELSINFESKIRLPLNYVGGDFTALLSNLLDDAINFLQSQPPNAREIILAVSYDSQNIFMELSISCSEEILFAENFPAAMKNLSAFQEKHCAKIKNAQTADRLSILVSFKIAQ